MTSYDCFHGNGPYAILKKDKNSASLMLDKDKNFGVSLVLDFRI